MTSNERLAIDELIERCRKAEGPDRELDALICAHLKVAPASMPDYVSKWEGEWKAAPQGGIVVLVQSDGINGPNFRAPFYTASIDAITALIEKELPGWQYNLSAYGSSAEASMGATGAFPRHRAPTPALALCLALLALQSKETSDAVRS
jgi:hypothetical protein